MRVRHKVTGDSGVAIDEIDADETWCRVTWDSIRHYRIQPASELHVKNLVFIVPAGRRVVTHDAYATV